MDKQQILLQTSDILKVAHLQVEVLTKNPEKFSAIEADLIKDYLRIAYDKLNVLTFLAASENEQDNQSEPVTEEPAVKEQNDSLTEQTSSIFEEDSIQETIPVIEAIQLITNTDDEEDASDTMKDELPYNQEADQNTSDAIQETLATRDADPKQEFPIDTNQPHIIADTFHEESNTVVDKLEKETEDHTLLSKISKLPLVDLKKAIGINDRFTFINELFQGNISSYNQFIDEVDMFTDGLEAWEYVEKIKTKKDWDSTSSAYKRLFDLIQRKFSAL